MTGEWSGRRVVKARAIVATWLPADCGKCGDEVDGTSEPWNVGHIKSRAAYPELTWVVSNWQPEHRRCSDGTGAVAGLEKALRRLGTDGTLDDRGRAALADLEEALFPVTEVGGQASLPASLSPGPRRTKVQAIEARPELTWSPDTMREFAWLTEFAEVPDNASPPLWMSPPAEDAVCSYAWSECEHHPALDDEIGVGAIAWIESVEKKRLRWWQRLAITRQLEHREDGTLCYPEILESASRRSGKSMRMRGVALWRMEFGAALFGEVQTVMHTGSDMAICREIQRGAWRWAEGRWGKNAVTKANGKECVESYAGDRWLVRSQDGVYGYDVTLGLVDEGWNVKPDTVSEGLEPATMERSSPQSHLTSTSHRRATSLLRGKISTAVVVASARTLLLLWGAPPGSDPSDPEVWRRASPHWTEDRRQMMADKYEKALAGEVDPQADDPDPMEGFKAQYLNMWKLVGRREAPGKPLLDEDDWHDLAALPDDRVPDAAAIESWAASGVTLALAWREVDTAIVSASDHRDLAEAVAALRRSGFRGRFAVSDRLASDPALAKLRTRPTKVNAGAAVADLNRLLGEGALHHDGGEHLTDQVLAVRTQPGVDGPRVVSRERADTVKAVAVAAVEARSRRTGNRLGFVGSST